MPTFEHRGASIYYEEFGKGFPILTFAPAGLQSTIAVWSQPSAPVNPTTEFAANFRGDGEAAPQLGVHPGVEDRRAAGGSKGAHQGVPVEAHARRGIARVLPGDELQSPSPACGGRAR